MRILIVSDENSHVSHKSNLGHTYNIVKKLTGHQHYWDLYAKRTCKIRNPVTSDHTIAKLNYSGSAFWWGRFFYGRHIASDDRQI